MGSRSISSAKYLAAADLPHTHQAEASRTLHDIWPLFRPLKRRIRKTKRALAPADADMNAGLSRTSYGNLTKRSSERFVIDRAPQARPTNPWIHVPAAT